MANGAEAINTNFNDLTRDQVVTGKKTFSDDAIFKSISVTGDLTQRYVATTFSIGYGVQVSAKRIGNLVTITFRGQNTGQIGVGVNPTELIPVGYRPIEFESIDFLVAGRHLDTYYHFNPDGKINYLGETIPVSSYFRGIRSYFTNDPWPGL